MIMLAAIIITTNTAIYKLWMHGPISEPIAMKSALNLGDHQLQRLDAHGNTKNNITHSNILAQNIGKEGES